MQIRLIPVSQVHEEYCQRVAAQLKAAGMRVEVPTGERLGKAIRNAELRKIPLMAVVGDQEMEDGTLTVRGFARSRRVEPRVFVAVWRNPERFDYSTNTLFVW